MVIRYRHCFQQKIHLITQYWQKIEKTNCKIKQYTIFISIYTISARSQIFDILTNYRI